MMPNGRIFLKSEWAPISDYWPALSFSKMSIGQYLSKEFRPGRDILIYVGTSGPETENPEHKSRLISAIVPEPNQILETRRIIPAESWAASVEMHGGDKWPHSLAVVRAASIEGPPFPLARQIIPRAYSAFAVGAGRGGVVEALDDERAAVMVLPVRELPLNLTPAVQAYLQFRESVAVDLPRDVRQEATRMANRIIDRVKKGGEERVTINPIRSAPLFTDLYALLTRIWRQKQGGRCALCGAPLLPGTENPMMQASADRIDSANGAYDDTNVQVTHLACNWAKNKYGVAEFEEWVDAIRGVDVTTEA
ncbi:hypothetical protein DK419_25910 [Methylobacterium terrae]|uniref:HNH endonuclease n=2 Tax=Methylobacterium terrae TaxID=2202827 RepID=A0A2U8WVA4_9HYPH|nr:hypothetical protein DK419_25910 [Methylobacterium terrae]